MNTQDKLILFPTLCGIAGFTTWYIFFKMHKTPAIEFDGPAEFGIALSILSGIIIFTALSFILPYIIKKLRP